ncbi:MAG: serine/threonine protein kinase [Polyangiaceae bacterium]|nr:serine/threonine protein kinase [Polyangiaceae bacterium]
MIGDDFRVERLVGAGGMGAIYLARQLSTGRKRALKLMQVDLADDPKLRGRFAQEASVGSRIKSEHVVEVVAAGLDEKTGFPWLAMEYLEGEDLWAHLGKRGPLGSSEVLDVLRQVCHALGAAHGVGIVHRDLKPANIFLSRSNRADVAFTVKVLDFGLAKAVADTTTMTEPIGTLLYMAPEQLRGHGICPATDVWALGLIAFELLTAKEYWLTAQGPAGLGAIADEIKQGIIIPASERARELGAPDFLPPGFDQWRVGVSICQNPPSPRYAAAELGSSAAREPSRGGRPTARRSFHLSKPTESKIRGGGARVECCPRTLARRASDAARQRFSASPAAQGTAPPSARRSPTSHSFPNPNINCSGTLTPTRVAGGALGPRPCSASRRVIWARVLATSAQRMGPEQRGQVSTSAAKT